MNVIPPYKGVRDFYPEDERVQRYMFDAMRKVVESFGYEEMNASILEPTELYAAKTSEEIVNEQTYTFIDRGERSVTLRPEMTPSVARMVAAKRRELGFPLRWYSIQNFFRYERPQRGRVREFWQLNADIFGISGIEADAEIIHITHRIMQSLGADNGHFRIHIASRGGIDTIANKHGIAGDALNNLLKLLDKKEKMAKEEFAEQLTKFDITLEEIESREGMPEETGKLLALISEDVGNALYDPSIVRGFNYYTGMVFEVFDTNPENPRAMFGGGRYDNLIEKYGGDSVPAVGFALGDVTMRNFLETHKLLEPKKLKPPTHLYLVPKKEEDVSGAVALAEKLRAKGANVALSMAGDDSKPARKHGIPYFAVYGADEETSQTLTIKNLDTDEKETLAFDAVAEFVLPRR